MKIEIINDNEIDLIFLIFDSSPELNLPNIDENQLLIEDKFGNLKCLTKQELEKMFFNNNEECKIYIFPQCPTGQYNNLIKYEILDEEIFDKIKDFINSNELIDLSFFKKNNLIFKFSENYLSRSFKEYFNNQFESLEHRLVLNKNSFLKNILDFNENLTKNYVTELPTLNYDKIIFKNTIKVDTNFLNSIPTSFDKINFNKNIDFKLFDDYENRLNNLIEKLNSIKL